MKILAKIIGAKLFKRLTLWYYKHFKSASFTTSPIYQTMVAVRAQEFDGYKKNIVTGDSVAAAGEMWFELIEDTRCTAIPGDRTDSFIQRIDLNVLIYKPQTVVMHLGGNDILAGTDMDIIIHNLETIIDRLQKGGAKRIGWLEVLPLGEQWITQNRRAADLCNIVKTTVKVDYLETRRFLRGDNGFVLPKYYGDGIHVNALAYNDVFYPVVARYIRGGI